MPFENTEQFFAEARDDRAQEIVYIQKLLDTLAQVKPEEIESLIIGVLVKTPADEEGHNGLVMAGLSGSNENILHVMHELKLHAVELIVGNPAEPKKAKAE